MLVYQMIKPSKTTHFDGTGGSSTPPATALRLFRRCQVKLHAEMPGQQHHRRRRVRASALRESEELGGDPQRADGGTTGGETSW